MKQYNRIRINKKWYDSLNLDDLLQDIHDEGEKDWVFAITNFLTDWFSDKPYIKAQTSGSTGIPKEIQLQKSAMVNSAKATCSFFGLSKEHHALLCLPVSYIAGKMMLVRAMVVGFNLKVVKPSSNPFWDIEEMIDFTAITPHQLFDSLDILNQKDIRKIIVGGRLFLPHWRVSYRHFHAAL
jgi:O-succinylbenzoic acid--CoA ligase